MSRIRCAAAAAILLATALLSAGPTNAQATAGPVPLRVMSFNVRYPSAEGEHAWPARRAIFMRTIAAADVDVIGTQELFQQQGQDIVAALPQFRWFGIDRRGGHDDEHMGIFYRADSITLLQDGAFWLSDRPTEAGSVDWGHPLPRMVSWGLFERKEDRRRFYLVNTHMPHQEQSAPARAKGARMIADWIAALPANIPVVLTGDFNAAPSDEPHSILTAGLHDAWEAVPDPAGPEGTYHGYSGTPGDRIDWIMTRGFIPRSVTTIATAHAGDYPSDHFPVVAELGW